MNLKCLGSGSSGNCYLLSTETETIVLDCGLPIREIKKGLDWDISKVVGVLCTHIHSDHSKSVKDFENMGIPVFKPFDKTKACPLKIRYGSFGVSQLTRYALQQIFLHLFPFVTSLVNHPHFDIHTAPASIESCVPPLALTAQT